MSGKTIAEVVADEPGMLAGGKTVEFGVMVMGGALVAEKQQQEQQEQEQQQQPPSAAATEAATSGDGVLGTEAFWDDLQGLLQKGVGDKGEAEGPTQGRGRGTCPPPNPPWGYVERN